MEVKGEGYSVTFCSATATGFMRGNTQAAGFGGL